MARRGRQARQRAELLDGLRARGTDRRVVGAVAAVARERFVPTDLADEAYADRPLPIGHRATISQPSLVARMVELAELTPDARVLDVGTGSGYAAALTAHLAAEVVSIERVPALAERARAALAEAGVDNVEVVVGDGWDGWPAGAPYDAILVAAAASAVPDALVDQLADGGRLVLPLGRPGAGQMLVRLVRRGDEVVRDDLLPVRFVPLVPGSVDDH